jgi:UDP-4-amino-4,6-dideoxy-N-acetyl-beta-L-altrosamine transaminase
MMQNDIPYSTQSIEQADLDAMCLALTSGWLTQGPQIPLFERAFADLHQVAHAVCVSNATAGLHIACLALGVGPGQSVWTSPNSFVASANCALYCGASVDFVDIDPQTRNMSVSELAKKLDLAERNNRLPAVVIPVHFSGLPCDLAPMRDLADRYGFKILEDASHAVGATYNGYPVGCRYADASVFSFHPVKIITTGEGGIVTTQDDVLAKRLRLLRSHGITRDANDFQYADEQTGAWHYEQQYLGYNYRLTDLQAALGLSQLNRLSQFHTARQKLASYYDSLLRPLALRLPSHTPSLTSNACSSWHLYVVELIREKVQPTRTQVFARLREAGIGVNLHYVPIHLQPYYRSLGFTQGQFPAAETYASQALSIPLFPSMTSEQQNRVVDEITKAIQN